LAKKSILFDESEEKKKNENSAIGIVRKRSTAAENKG
jgi:hypothetical protein